MSEPFVKDQEFDQKYFDGACRRIEDAARQTGLFAGSEATLGAKCGCRACRAERGELDPYSTLSSQNRESPEA